MISFFLLFFISFYASIKNRMWNRPSGLKLNCADLLSATLHLTADCTNTAQNRFWHLHNLCNQQRVVLVVPFSD
jgi:hypothetical protein